MYEPGRRTRGSVRLVNGHLASRMVLKPTARKEHEMAKNKHRSLITFGEHDPDFLPGVVESNLKPVSERGLFAVLCRVRRANAGPDDLRERLSASPVG